MSPAAGKGWRNLVSAICLCCSAACLAAMMLVTVADVALRAVLDSPLRGSFELVELLLCATFFLALPPVFLRDGHLVVNVIDDRLPVAVAGLKRCSAGLAAVLLGVMAWQGGIAAYDAAGFGDVTGDLGLPKLLYWLPLLFGLLVAAAAAVIVLVRGADE